MSDSESQLLQSPMEQFEIMPLYSMYIGWLDVSVTNQTLILCVIMTSVLCVRASLMSSLDSSQLMIPFRFQFVLEKYLRSILFLSYDRINKKEGSVFFPLILTLSFYMLCLNLSGLVPHSTAMLSHVIVTVTISGSFFIGMNYICIRRYGIRFFTLLLPPNTSIGVALILVPVEALSFFCRPFSLATRLFANSMGGHTLVKIVVGCAWSFMNCSGLSYLVHGVATLILIPLMILETTVALIQSAVFVNLICIYMGEALSV
jgi:ATP synthase subunit 6